MQQEEDIELVVDSETNPPEQLSKSEVVISKIWVMQTKITGNNKTWDSCFRRWSSGGSTISL